MLRVTRFSSRRFSSAPHYHTLLVEKKAEGYGLITFNRPKALNALNTQVLQELVAALDAFEKDDSVGAVVLTGSEKAFVAGADIKVRSRLLEARRRCIPSEKANSLLSHLSDFFRFFCYTHPLLFSSSLPR